MKTLNTGHKFKSFLLSPSIQNGLILSVLALSALWAYLRVQNIFPVILGDEYLYSMNARKVDLWGESGFGDFSNYLFNFVYSSTNLCTFAFYDCVKGLNAAFFFGVLASAYFLLKKVSNAWVAGAFAFAVSLSPISVYVSMFLPEMMFFFGVMVILHLTLRAAELNRANAWLVAGASVGLVSLIKPHAWLSFLAIIIFFLVVAASNWKGFNFFVKNFSALLAGAVIGRVAVGLLIAGPKAVDFFGQYFSFELLTQLLGIEINGDTPQASDVEATSNAPIEGVFSLFPAQLWVHLGTFLALCAPAAAILLARLFAMLRIPKAREKSLEINLSTLSVIWIGVMIVEVVAFTGWITGSGDDHTTRILLRYYEFLLVIVPLAALGALWNQRAWISAVWARWLGGSAAVYGMSVASLGLFSTLTIQIADAPSLAGFVVNREVYNLMPTMFFVAIASFMAFPRYSKYPVLAVSAAALILTGFQAHEQYQSFRGQAQPADMLGEVLANSRAIVSPEKTLIVADSRFNATAAAFAADEAEIGYLVLPPGYLSPDMVGDEIDLVGSVYGLNLPGFKLLHEADGYWVYLRE